MKAYKVELIIIDFDEVGKEDIIVEIENANYGNDCIFPRVVQVKEKEFDYSDDHFLNKKDLTIEKVNEFFYGNQVPPIGRDRPETIY